MHTCSQSSLPRCISLFISFFTPYPPSSQRGVNLTQKSEPKTRNPVSPSSLQSCIHPNPKPQALNPNPEAYIPKTVALNQQPEGINPKLLSGHGSRGSTAVLRACPHRMSRHLSVLLARLHKVCALVRACVRALAREKARESERKREKARESERKREKARERARAREREGGRQGGRGGERD